MRAFVKACLCVLVMLSSAAFAAEEKMVIEDTMDERVKPVGSLCMAGNPCAAPVVAARASGEPRSGEEVYTSKCSSCHATGAANAPKFGDVAAWASRIGAGIETVYANAINGLNGMPAKGLCMDCSDDEIKAAVDHMLDNSK